MEEMDSKEQAALRSEVAVARCHSELRRSGSLAAEDMSRQSIRCQLAAKQRASHSTAREIAESDRNY